MIIVKAVKADPPPNASPYRFEVPKASNTPFSIALLLGSLAFYLRELFPSWASREPENKPEPPQENDGATADPITAEVPALPVGPADEGAEPKYLGRMDSSGWTPLPKSLAYPLIESPEIPSIVPESRLEVRTPWAGGAFGMRPLNDNEPPNQPLPSAGSAPNSPHAGGSIVNGSGNTPDGDGAGDPDEIEEEDEGDGNPLPAPCNRAPRLTGPVVLYDVFSCSAVLIGLVDFLRNASDPDGDVLSIRNLTVSSGTLSQTGGGWLYDPSAMGPIIFTYEITDGVSAVIQTATLTVRPNPPLIGSDGDDVLVGSDCADEIDARGGSDAVDAGAGSDIVHGGTGADHIVAGFGDDVIFGGVGDDIIFGGPGDDRISGGEGNDRLFGEDGADTIAGDKGDDLVVGGAGDDSLHGGEGNDTVRGEDGNDLLMGEAGDDTLEGGTGDDIADGGAGQDAIDGGEGRDLLAGGTGGDTVRGGAGDDVVLGDADTDDDAYDGGEGRDTLSYAATTSGIVVDLRSHTASGLEIGTDAITGFETIHGGAGGDHFVVGSEPVTLLGGQGEDVFEFAAAAGESVASGIIHEILDFMVGDRIRMSHYDLLEKVVDTIEDRFEDIYGDDVDDDELPIRVRHERTDEVFKTYVEADMDRDDTYELSIMLDGHHLLMVVENA